MEEIVVHVVRYPDRKNLMMRYRDPVTRKPIARSTGTAKRKEAEKVAAKWEADLHEGRYKPASRITWRDFVALFDEHHLGEVAPRTAASYHVSFRAYERLCRPKLLRDCDTASVTRLRTALREDGLAPSTVANYLRHLAAAFRWAIDQGLMATMPNCKPPKGSAQSVRMKGRPITAEEFDRMLAVVPRVVGEDRAGAWRFYLRALWLSGLRLSESLTLTWDDDEDAISIDLTRGRPMLRIPAAVEKGKKDRLLPLTPDFAELVVGVPPEQRHGPVFRGLGHVVNVSATISRMGKLAGVKVTAKKFASAHDLRRAFGTRWSKLLSPARLKAIMRHADIATTMRYYVDEASDELAEALYSAAEVTPWVTPSVAEASGKAESRCEATTKESWGSGT